LPASARVRLQRLAPRALYKEDQLQLIVPLPNSPALATELEDLLSALVPE
jgi:hypothetical protein